MNYNVIIVGAGSAGCVLAARLSEDPARTVLLVEAGPDYADPATLPPDIANGLAPTYSHDWGYVSEPDFSGRSFRLPRAKIIGGCSATNAAFALRGAPGDYDNWVALGNPGWSFAEVLPFFRALEHDADFDDQHHGRTGPIPICRAPTENLLAIQHAFLEACWADGHARPADLNAPGALGAAAAPMNLVGNRRQSTALTYLARARGRPNLAVRSGVLADRVLFDGRRAIAVRLADGQTIAGEWVILAGGTYGSPALLCRSGLGPADHLRSLGIPPLADLPGVGENLIDHPLFSVRCAASPGVVLDGPLFQTVLLMKSSTDVSGHDVLLTIRSATAAPPADSPTGAHYSLIAALMRPRSRGRLWLRSADPAAAPAIDLRYFSDPADLPRLMAAVRAARRLVRTPPLSEFTIGELVPGNHRSDGELDLEPAVVGAASTFHHPVGTCRMGPVSDPNAVVDANGRVHGVQRLSVVDASIMPTIPSANTFIPTIMIAERVANTIANQS